MHQPTTLAFLQAYPPPEAALAASVEQITQVLKQAGHPTAQKAAIQVYETLKLPQLTADEITSRTRVAPDAGPGQAVAAPH